MRHKRRPQRDDYEDDEDSLGENLAAVNDRLDDLTRQLERMARSNAPTRETDRSADRVSEAVARLDRRLDQIVAESRSAASEAERRVARMPLPPSPMPMQMPMAPPPPSSGPVNWATEISQRQRALDGEPQLAIGGGRAPGQDLSGLEHQLRHITTQIASLHRPYEDGFTALRGDLAEIGRALTEALPRRAVEALEGEVRSLAERVDYSRSAGADSSSLNNLEQGLAEVRDALRHLTPAESLAGVDEAVRGLSRKIDQISMSSGGQDPAAFQQLEQAIGSLRSLVSNVASDGALAQLAAEVRTLANHFERAATESSGDALARLDSRIETLIHSGRAVPPELEASIRELSERLERVPLTHGDQLALGSLEDRIVKLYEKLDASDARLGSLGAIERGIADLLVAVEEMRSAGGPRGLRAPATEPPQHESPPPAPQLYIPAPQEPPPPPAPVLQAPTPAPVAVAPIPPSPPQAQRAAPPPRPPEPRRPINPNLPPDTPLEPGTGAPKVKPGSAAARIAASEAALGNVKPAAVETQSSAVAAARSAAKSAVAEGPPAVAPKERKKSFELTEDDMAAVEAGPRRMSIGKAVKAILLAGSVIVIVLGTVHVAMEMFFSGDEPASTQDENMAPAPAPSLPPATVPSRPMPTPEGSLPPPAGSDPGTTGQIGRPASMFDPATILQHLPRIPSSDVTGSVSRQAPARGTAPVAPAAAPPALAQAAIAGLPASVGPVLRTAVANGDPAAEYEIALRYAEGRGVPTSLDEAARWLDRSARAGFAPAQFRLASLNEKGEGLKKDLQAARRLYIAAADKGHAKAMHNLAVLHAEGVDGKPDYKVAAQWFRKAAAYGIADSQFNLAILYARGIGVEPNLAESYKWFALAAGNGDRDAGRKRDDVAARLDQSSLMAAKLAAQTFVPEREPEAATSVRAPAGGWDRPAVTAAPARSKGRTSAPAAQ